MITTPIGRPNDPSYPSNHACASGTFGYVLGGLFPREKPVWAAVADSAGESRIFAGIHYRFAENAGLKIARQVSDLALAIEVESALATYGIFRFGAEAFQAYERTDHPDLVTKLFDVLDTEYAGRPAPDDPLVAAARRLVARRNALIHYEMMGPPELIYHGTTVGKTISRRRLMTELATASLSDMNFFLADFPKRDRESALFFR
jgi:hypothetical protein